MSEYFVNVSHAEYSTLKELHNESLLGGTLCTQKLIAHLEYCKAKNGGNFIASVLNVGVPCKIVIVD